MMGTRRAIVVVLLLAACQSRAPHALEPDTRSARSAPPASSCKPEAPVVVEIVTRALGGDALEVTARATPTKALAALELRLALPAHAQALGATATRFGATAAGEVRELTVRVRADARTSSITAIARVPVADVEMARTATVAIGALAPPPRTVTYALPDGELAREVRP